MDSGAVLCSTNGKLVLRENEWRTTTRQHMTPPTDASTWFEFEDHFWRYGGKDARLRVIPVGKISSPIRTAFTSTPPVLGKRGKTTSAHCILDRVGCMEPIRPRRWNAHGSILRCIPSTLGRTATRHQNIFNGPQVAGHRNLQNDTR